MGYRLDEPFELSVDADKILNTVQDRFIDFRHRLGFRGQRCASWRLTPTLRRYFNKLTKVCGPRSEVSYIAVQRELYESFRDNVLINRDLEPSELNGIDCGNTDSIDVLTAYCKPAAKKM